MTNTTVATNHRTTLNAFCLQDDCNWSHNGSRAQIRAQQHAELEGHRTVFQRQKEILFVPDNLKT